MGKVDVGLPCRQYLMNDVKMMVIGKCYAGSNGLEIKIAQYIRTHVEKKYLGLSQVDIV